MDYCSEKGFGILCIVQRGCLTKVLLDKYFEPTHHG